MGDSAVSVIVALSFVTHAFILLITPFMLNVSTGGTMLFFCVCNALNAAFVLSFVRETKGVPLEFVPEMFERACFWGNADSDSESDYEETPRPDAAYYPPARSIEAVSRRHIEQEESYISYMPESDLSGMPIKTVSRRQSEPEPPPRPDLPDPPPPPPFYDPLAYSPSDGVRSLRGAYE